MLSFTLASIVIAHKTNVPSNDKWAFSSDLIYANLQQDVKTGILIKSGGFGIGSDLAWQIEAHAGYRFSKLFQLTGGFRFISINYETGNGQSLFLYDINMSGPVIRFGLNL